MTGRIRTKEVQRNESGCTNERNIMRRPECENKREKVNMKSWKPMVIKVTGGIFFSGNCFYFYF